MYILGWVESSRWSPQMALAWDQLIVSSWNSSGWRFNCLTSGLLFHLVTTVGSGDLERSAMGLKRCIFDIILFIIQISTTKTKVIACRIEDKRAHYQALPFASCDLIASELETLIWATSHVLNDRRKQTTMNCSFFLNRMQASRSEGSLYDWEQLI